MKGRVTTGSAEELKLWRSLMAAWNPQQIALPRDLAQRYTRAYPDNVWGWVVLADMLASLAHYDQAKAALRRAQALAPKTVRAEIYAQWGHLYSEMGDHATATKHYRKAVALKPKDTRLVYLGASLAKEGKLAEAKRFHRRAIALVGSCADEAHHNLGLIYRAEGKYEQALIHFDHAIKIDREYKDAKEARADVLAALKQRRANQQKGTKRQDAKK